MKESKFRIVQTGRQYYVQRKGRWFWKTVHRPIKEITYFYDLEEAKAALEEYKWRLTLPKKAVVYEE